jgi:hypothetical protein
MEKLKKVLGTISVIIRCLIDFTFVILELPYIYIMGMLLSYGTCDIVYLWFPICGVMSMWIDDWSGKIDYSIDGHILIRKLFKK